MAVAGCHEQPTSQQPFNLLTAHSNNAVALSPDGKTLYSFNGLTAGRTYADISHQVFACNIAERSCKSLDDLPVPQGRLASITATLGDYIYVIGGYSVAKDDSEKSQPEVIRFDPKTNAYKTMAPMPTPVDDTIALSHQDRYIYLISGWHDEANVNLVQVYDSQTNQWLRANDYPGVPVFGHSGGIVDGKIVIADGVKQLKKRLPNGSRYAASDEVWRGDIDPDDPRKITWWPIASHGKSLGTKPLYRMASSGNARLNQVVFAGGSDNPYNYNGIGYDGKPSQSSSAIFAYDFGIEAWQSYNPMKKATMDHRGLLFAGDKAYIVGGMDKTQNVIPDIAEIFLNKDEPK